VDSNLKRAVRDLNAVHAGKMAAAAKTPYASRELGKAIAALNSVRAGKARAAVKGAGR
jgi:hypothetical protein